MIEERRTAINRGAWRRRSHGAAVLLLLLTFVTALGTLAAESPDEVSAAEETTAFWGGYVGWNDATSRLDRVFGIYGQEPAAQGRYPVFMYFTGGVGPFQALYWGNDGQLMVNEMAKRGFVAISVEYDSRSFPTCPNLWLKSVSIFSRYHMWSAVNSVCSRGKADCSKGIVVAGLSHGSSIAILGKNFDDRVQATYSIGDATWEGFLGNAACLGNGNRTLPSERLRVINGESDPMITWSRSPDAVRRGLELVTGSNCGATAYSCVRNNQSGWYMVRDSEVEDGVADHCYPVAEGGCGVAPRFDVGWAPPAANEWSLSTNLNWLQQFVTPGP